MAEPFDEQLDSTARDRQERLTVDQEILAVLKSCDFRGPAWAEFIEALVAYAYQPLLFWIRSRRIVHLCRGKGIPLPTDFVKPMTDQEMEQVTRDVLADAVIKFESLLRQGRWSPQGGATLTTYFVGQCIICFPNSYRAWRRDNRPPSWESLSALDEDSARFSGVQGQTDPADAALAAVEVQRMAKELDSRTFDAIRLQQEGYQIVEIAELLGESPKAIEMALYHHRRRMRDEGEQNEPA